jgi:uncharacterized protein (DUF1778 family)
MQTQTETTKEQNLHIRTSATEKATLAAAARISGQNVSRFVLTTALKEAEQIISEETVIRLSAEKYDAFVKRLDEAPRDIPALREQMEKAVPFQQ